MWHKEGLVVILADSSFCGYDYNHHTDYEHTWPHAACQNMFQTIEVQFVHLRFYDILVLSYWIFGTPSNENLTLVL